jgi:hypothetical protein
MVVLPGLTFQAVYLPVDPARRVAARPYTAYGTNDRMAGQTVIGLGAIAFLFAVSMALVGGFLF